ncbi:hypothetical protein Bhyg_15385 [Pseudolycoriella hygida]|uniref:Uncharacterized protein n=1 Tax=Pseudolycoriella hygida TaxID=35572 RepID=A0A9Q0RWJ3_9DIPT|nr:hypothetical protein Bhyg_15385 [Pseudolycoriella hygida]
MASSSRDCSSPKQRSLINISSAGVQQNKQMMRSTAPMATSTDSNSSGSLNLSISGSPTTLLIQSSGNSSLPPIGSGPSRQRSLRDRLKEGITGSFTWHLAVV